MWPESGIMRTSRGARSSKSPQLSAFYAFCSLTESKLTESTGRILRNNNSNVNLGRPKIAVRSLEELCRGHPIKKKLVIFIIQLVLVVKCILCSIIPESLVILIKSTVVERSKTLLETFVDWRFLGDVVAPARMPIDSQHSCDEDKISCSLQCLRLSYRNP